MKKCLGWLLVFFAMTTMAVGPARGRSEPGPSADASITGLSRAFNPAISLHGLFYAMDARAEDEEEDVPDYEGEHDHGDEPERRGDA
jgi:hypothetical protein